MHPLTPDLSTLTDDELHNKRAELQNRLMFSYRSGYSDMVGQLQMIIGDYEMEIQRRNQKILDDLQSRNKNFGNIINISK